MLGNKNHVPPNLFERETAVWEDTLLYYVKIKTIGFYG